jgi:hypothetical protein
MTDAPSAPGGALPSSHSSQAEGTAQVPRYDFMGEMRRCQQALAMVARFEAMQGEQYRLTTRLLQDHQS